MFFTGVINLYLCCDLIYSEMWKLLELPAFTSCRSVRMYTATKSFERFRQPKSVEDEKKSDDNAIPKSTAYNTKRSCKVFEEWKRNRLVKSCTLKPGGLFTTKDFEEYKLWTRLIQICLHAVWTTGCWKFVQEVSNSSGERYPSRSLYSITCGLKRHLPDVNGSAALSPLDMSDRR